MKGQGGFVMRHWIIAAALALAAAPALAETTQAPAPYPANALQVSAADNGGGHEIAAGGQVAIALPSTPSVGSIWSVAAKPDFLSAVDELSGPTSARPLLGAPRWQVFVFTADSAGSGEIRLEKKGRDGTVLETFSFTIVAQ